jgi:membrane-bound lytic murein transglycosylase D
MAGVRWRFLVFFLAFGLGVAVPVYGAPVEPGEFPPLLSSLRSMDSLEFCGERVPLEVQEVRERLEKQLMLSVWNRPQAILWLKRSRRYLPYVEKMLKENGLPDDLKYVAVAESALRPHAGSAKGAMGFWQFLSGTGQKYGLVIDSRIDERRDIYHSTRAAISYLKDLHEKFGSWTLAVAGHNMGDEALREEIEEQQTRDYYELYLPLETQQFLFRILSVKLIFSDPERYGFKLNEKDYYPPLEFDKVQVKCSQEMSLVVIAHAAKTHFKEIKDLNPQIRGHHIDPGIHEILVPKGASMGFQGRYEKLAREYIETHDKQIYVVRRGDNLSMIAQKFHVSLANLILWNRLDPRRSIRPGDRLIVYTKNTESN